jgi:hypothetical protein
MTLSSREAETISSWQALPFFLLDSSYLTITKQQDAGDKETIERE